MRDISAFMNKLNQWLAGQAAIEAVLLVGSFARGTAREGSDVDLVIITSNPQTYLQDDRWIETFGSPTRIEHEDWGLLQSKRVFYASGLEVEFGITPPAWAATAPVDAGTRQVVTDGAAIISDPHGLLAALLEAVQTAPKRLD